ncbi:MAG: transketolase [Clostridia bacterium]|nr:transketolase [Clostridia bacterium]
MAKIATREAYGKALVELGRQNKDIVVLDADLSKSTKTALFAKEFPERFFNMGIAEQNLMCTAAGLALSGKIPFASTFAVFATGRAFEQIRNGIAYPQVNVKIAATHSGLTVGEDGASHQAIEDIALMRVLPNMTVVVPADAEETRQAVQAVADYHGPVYLRLGRPAVETVYENNYKFQIGKADQLRKGQDAAIIACGIMVNEALVAAEELASEGINVMVVNMSTIKPIDREAVLAAAATGAIVTAEEHTIMGGLGSAVAEVLATEKPVPMAMVGIGDTFGESGKPAELMEKYGLTASNIKTKVKKLLEKKI